MGQQGENGKPVKIQEFCMIVMSSYTDKMHFKPLPVAIQHFISSLKGVKKYFKC